MQYTYKVQSFYLHFCIHFTFQIKRASRLGEHEHLFLYIKKKKGINARLCIFNPAVSQPYIHFPMGTIHKHNLYKGNTRKDFLTYTLPLPIYTYIVK